MFHMVFSLYILPVANLHDDRCYFVDVIVGSIHGFHADPIERLADLMVRLRIADISRA